MALCSSAREGRGRSGGRRGPPGRRVGSIRPGGRGRPRGRRRGAGRIARSRRRTARPAVGSKSDWRSNRARSPNRAHRALARVDHLVGEVDADHAMPGFEEGLADQPGTATGVEDERIGREVGLEDEPGQGHRVGLHRGLSRTGRPGRRRRSRGPDHVIRSMSCVMVPSAIGRGQGSFGSGLDASVVERPDSKSSRPIVTEKVRRKNIAISLADAIGC